MQGIGKLYPVLAAQCDKVVGIPHQGSIAIGNSTSPLMQGNPFQTHYTLKVRKRRILEQDVKAAVIGLLLEDTPR